MIVKFLCTTTFWSFFFVLLSVPAAAKFDIEKLAYDDAVNNGLSRKVAPHFLSALGKSDVANIIVAYSEALAPPSSGNLRQHDLQQDTRLLRLRNLKQRVNNKLAIQDYRVTHQYDQLPMQALQLNTAASLAQLLSDPDVIAIYNDEPLELHLAQSLPFIHAEFAISHGIAGQGTSIAILDSGVDYTNAAFGNCTTPGIPAGCNVSAAIEIATSDGVLDSIGHGTNVAAIAVGVAPATKIIALDIMNGANISSSDVIAGINWVIANHVAYNIVALNMSFGSSTTYSAQCSIFNPFLIPVSNAKAAGISVIASSGNNANSQGIASPACTPGALAIGAIYDADVGGVNWSVCTDTTSAENQVACFSNSAPYLFLLAPGVTITAGGKTLSGTSQAAPHVAGAMALLQSAYPNSALEDLEAQLRESNTQITDPRNNFTTPLLDIRTALGLPINAQSEKIPLLPPFGSVLLFFSLIGISRAIHRKVAFNAIQFFPRMLGK